MTATRAPMPMVAMSASAPRSPMAARAGSQMRLDGSGAAALEDPQLRNHSPAKNDNRDSGTSSPQPNEVKFINSLIGQSKNGAKMSINVEYHDQKVNEFTIDS